MTTEPYRLLVTDDNPVSRKLLIRSLEQEGHHVHSAENGRRALEELRDRPFDLVLLDVEMPELDGYQTLAAIKTDPDLRHLPVIMVTAVDEMASTIRCIELGAEDYLPKPFDPILLRARVNACLEKKRLLDQEHKYLKAMERELEIGREIQRGFLPESLPQIAGWEIVATLQSAREVAGDFYDVFTLPDGKIALVLADVCDKGVGAALFMTLFRSLLRFTMQSSDLYRERAAADQLKTAIQLTNNYIADTHGDTGTFATIFFGLLDPGDGVLDYINAGQEPPWIIRANGARESLPSTGMPVGVIPDGVYRVVRAILQPGDVLCGFTDGVADTKDPDGNFFGKPRVFETLSTAQRSAAGWVEQLTDLLQTYIAGGERYDDVTLMAVRRSPAPA